MAITDRLAALRAHTGARRTMGLDDATVARFAASHPDLVEAIDAAVVEHERVRAEFPDLMDLDEAEQAHRVQGGYVNFYSDDTVNPYVALVARGPWVVTLNGAVLHDSGGCGMLGFGHTPKHVLDAMAQPQVMANIMTPNLSQLRFDRAMRAEVGHTRGGCPYAKFLCLNSGSESVSLASRIADVNAKLMTDAGGRHAGRTIKRLVVKGSFHGRTERPALYSDSSRKTYIQHLASFRGVASMLTVEPYDLEAL
jgi:4-aminobutyrate aminotransferase-like enzyme